MQERGTDVLLRYFEEMNLTEEVRSRSSNCWEARLTRVCWSLQHPTLDTLRALTRDPSIPFLVPDDPPTSQDLQAGTGLLDHLWSYISVPQQPVEGAKISVEYCATLYNELADWLYPPSTDAVLFVDDSSVLFLLSSRPVITDRLGQIERRQLIIVTDPAPTTFPPLTLVPWTRRPNLSTDLTALEFKVSFLKETRRTASVHRVEECDSDCSPPALRL